MKNLRKLKRMILGELVRRSHDKNIIGTKWIFKNKLNENGEVIRNKARLVYKGYAQQEGIQNGCKMCFSQRGLRRRSIY